MTTKIKITVNRNTTGKLSKVNGDIIVQDCNMQVSHGQYTSMLAVYDAMSRMMITWEFLHIRPRIRIKENAKIWWEYAYSAVVEQRVKPYIWSRIKSVRQSYKYYCSLYRQILLYPNDTELKLDLQKYEDQLSVVNIIIARQHMKLSVSVILFSSEDSSM